MNSPHKLRVGPGEIIRREHHNGLVALAESLTWQRGRLKGRHLPDGFIPHLRAVTTAAKVAHPWAVEIEGKDSVLLLTIAPGTVGGIVPVIGERALDDLDDDGEPPRLTVGADAWAPRGTGERALLMLRYTLGPDLAVTAATPLAVPAVPAPQDFTWHKLLGFLTRTAGEVRYRPMCFFNQYFDALPGRAAGRFQALPRCA